jgi:tRNA(Ile)-lysidine synthase
MHESIFLSLINEEKNNMVVHFPKQLCIERSYDNLLFYFKEENSTSKEFDQEINEIPARISLPNGAILSITYVDKMVKNNLDTYTYVCLEDQLKFPIHIRTRRPGDRMRYKGLKGSKKIKDIFIDEKVPRSERDNIYVVADNADEIFWLIGMKKAILPEALHNGKYLLFEYIETNKDLHKEEENAKRH